MRPLLVMLLVSTPAWAQTNPNGAPSKAVQQEQKQADYARKGHPSTGQPKQESASIKTKDGKKPAKSKPGEASIRTK